MVCCKRAASAPQIEQEISTFFNSSTADEMQSTTTVALGRHIEDLKNKIKALKDEKEQIESGRLSEAKRKCTNRIFGYLFGILSVASIIGQVIAEFANRESDSKITTLSNVFDACLIAVTALASLCWYKSTQISTKQRELEQDISDRLKYDKFIDHLKDFKEDANTDSWELLREAHTELAPRLQSLIPINLIAPKKSYQTPSITTRIIPPLPITYDEKTPEEPEQESLLTATQGTYGT